MIRMRGETRAQRFEALVRPHVGSMYQAALKYLRDPHDAEDLVQDVLEKLYPRLRDLERVEALRPWLLRVLYRQYVDLLRKRSRMPGVAADETALLSVADPAAGPERMAADAQNGERLRAALELLTDEQRLLLDLHLAQGYTLEELTRVFDAPLGTLKARVHRLRARIRSQLVDATFSSD
jgi:RNA polymerase sigma factor (sigma-70 family)